MADVHVLDLSEVTPGSGDNLILFDRATGVATSTRFDTLKSAVTSDVNAIVTQHTSQIQTLTNETDDIVNVLGAKNLLPIQSTTQVVNGVTFTVNSSDGSVTANGTATADANFNVVYRGTGVRPNGTDFILSGCPSGGSENTYYIAVTKTISGGGQNVGSDYGDGLEFTLESAVTDIGTYIHVASGVTINKTFYPMIRPSSIVDSTYVPYAMTNRELTDAFKNTSLSRIAGTNCNITYNETVAILAINIPLNITSNKMYNQATLPSNVALVASLWEHVAIMSSGWFPTQHNCYISCANDVYGSPIDLRFSTNSMTNAVIAKTVIMPRNAIRIK